MTLGFYCSISWDFFCHQLGFFSSISRDFFLPSETRPLRHGFCIGYFPFCIGYFPFCIGYFPFCIGYFPFLNENHDLDFSLPSVGIFFCHQSGFFSSISRGFFLPSETRPLRHGSCIGYFPSCIGYFPFCIGYFPFCIGYFPFSKIITIGIFLFHQ